MSRIVTVEEVSAHLPQLLAHLESGEEVLLVGPDGTPLARLAPLETSAETPASDATLPPRVPGMDQGKIRQNVDRPGFRCPYA